MDNQKDKNDKLKNHIIYYIVCTITLVAGVYIGNKLGIRSRLVIYMLVFIEIILYCVVKWILGKIR